MSDWKDKLTPPQAQFMQEMVDQVPETMGARGIFVGVLNKLANGGGKFRYYIVKDDDVHGTNDTMLARFHAQNEDHIVIDTQKSLFLQPDELDEDGELVGEIGDDDSDVLELRQ